MSQEMTLERQGTMGQTIPSQVSEKQALERQGEVLKINASSCRYAISSQAHQGDGVNQKQMKPVDELSKEKAGCQKHCSIAGNTDCDKESAALSNRVLSIALHIPWYGFRTQARISIDSRVSASAISRLIRGQSQPSLAIALRITSALSKRLGKTLDVGEVFSLYESYPTASVCELTGCRSCCLSAPNYDFDTGTPSSDAATSAKGGV
jgi:hypothetical protein